MKNKIFKKAGFTLIEILIIMVLTGLLFMGLFGSHLQIQDVIRTQSFASRRGNQALFAIQTFSRDLNNLHYEDWHTKSFFIGNTGKSLAGNDISNTSTVNFATNNLYSNPSVLQGRVYSVTYFTEISERSGKLTLYRKEDIFVDYEKTDQGIAIPILEDILAFELEYSTNGDSWKNEWNSKLARKPPMYIKSTFRWIENDAEREFIFTTSPPILFLR